MDSDAKKAIGVAMGYTDEVAEGKADIGADGKVPASQLPSYIDDVIEGYYLEGVFYEDAEHTTEIVPENGKIYLDVTSEEGLTYRWSGTRYVPIGGGGGGEINKKITISLVGNLGNIPVGNTVNVYARTLDGDVLLHSFEFEETTSVEAPIGTAYKITATQDVEGFVNPNTVTGILFEDTTATITYKEFGSIETWDDIGELAYYGVAKTYMNEGDVMEEEYTDHGGAKVTIPWKVLGFRDCVLENGDVYHNVPVMAMFPYCTKESLPFHSNEALFANVSEVALAPGTYHFDIINTYDTWQQGKSYQFTLTQPLPVNGQIRVPSWGAPEGREVKTYSDGMSQTAIETVTLTEGDGGTKLGELHATNRYPETGCNCMQRVRYGNGNYKEAFQRQWIAKKGLNGAFFSLQSPWDIAPSNVASYNGFMDGLPEEMLRNIPAARVRTAYNTVGEPTNPNYYDVYDKFFLLSVEEMYGSPQIADVEGPYFETIKQATGLTAPSNGNNDGRKHYAIEAQTSAQGVRLRSCYRGSASDTWLCHYSGGLNNGTGANNSYRCCPACYILSIPEEDDE